MTWLVTWSSLAARDMEDLDLPIAARIRRAARRFAETGHGDVRRLTGQQLEWRLRVGRWRVLFTFDLEARKIIVLRVLPRSTAYR